ncbi:MAG TPA: glycosyltransferase [Pseudomonas sp.]|nr:glycosyltransferase [Pseudomonas sp.]
MKRLNVVDNPGERPLAEGDGWLEALAPEAGLLLIGFDDDDAIEVRRRLAGRLEEQRILHIPAPAQEHLARVDRQLWELVPQRLADGLGAEQLHWIGHAGQTPRWAHLDSVPQDEACPPHSPPRLAFVAPLPPEATGIADYSAELLPYLAAHYEITLVVDQPDIAPDLVGTHAVMSPAQFIEAYSGFDRVLYQVGNSMFHSYQFPLLQRCPGVVVLHDVFLFDAVWWQQECGNWPDGLRRQLFHEHGFPAVLALEAGGHGGGSRGPEEYPVNGFVTHEAAGLIMHSRFASELDRRWRPDAWQEAPAIIPHLRALPELDDERRARARRELQLSEDACVIASFGGINPKKMSDQLVEAFLGGDWGEREVILALVGAQHAGDFGQALERRLRAHPAGRQVRVTGYVSRSDYLRWLRAADVAVQLRQDSRGETSGAILDAMAHGLAVVANAHGSSAELPEEALVMLPDRFCAEQLGKALEALVAGDERRHTLGEQARCHVARQLDPVQVAKQYRDAIESFSGRTRRERHERWLDRLAGLSALRRLDEGALLEVTGGLCELDTTAPAAAPRILFDVSTIAWHDLKTGIERVTRRLADQLLRHPPQGWRVELVRWGGDDFHLARGFASEQLGIEPPAPDRPCEARPGDIYVSVEWAPPLLEQAGHALKRMRARGVRCYFTVHDLLPLRLPHCFPEDIPARMQAWFNAIAELADGITCVSATVADDVRQELSRLALPRSPWVRHFHLGADFAEQADAASPSEEEQAQLQVIDQAGGATLLMVGTLEPRKGHRQVLDALERCWERQLPLNLVIVGKQGWNVDKLAGQLRHHPMAGQRLHWVEGASDAMLSRLYADSDALLAASLGEGFGLPLIEAAHRGIPILARDIPVFREVAGEHARYFHAESAEQLAGELQAWYLAWQSGGLPDSRALPCLTWAQSADAWLAPILADLPRPQASISPLDASPADPGSNDCRRQSDPGGPGTSEPAPSAPGANESASGANEQGALS